MARQNAVDAKQGGHITVPGTEAVEWLDSGQCRDCDQPAFNYVRAIEASKPGINAGGIRCERDVEGNCIKATLCGDTTGKDDCLADHEPRAWSSPIFVDWSG